MQEEYGYIDSKKLRKLIDTALGKIKADIVVANADMVNVYSGELLRGQSVAVKEDRIAYVGKNAEHTIGPDTKVIDATGKTLIPGLIDAHNHVLAHYTIDEFLKYAMRGGTTAVISESIELAVVLGYHGIQQFIKAAGNQPVKIFTTVAPLLTTSPATRLNAVNPQKLRRLLKQKKVVGLGEAFWQYVLQGNEETFQLFSETINQGKAVEGHSAGARGNNLVAYIASGVSSCHEPTTVEEVLERLRLGIHTILRENDTRKDLEAVAKIKDKPIDFRRLALAADAVEPRHLIENGYMEFLVQKAIDLGFDPIVAIQMGSLNAAEHFSLDNHIGGIAPFKYADMVIIPDLRTIRAELVISNGQVIAEKGQILVQPRKHVYSRASLRSVHLPRKLEPADFIIKINRHDTPVKIRVINLVGGALSREEHITMTPEEDLLGVDIENDILKVAVIERTSGQGKMFTGLIKGIGIKEGAIASSATWDLPGIIVSGTNDGDMAGAVNRVFAMQGGVAICHRGKILADVPLPIAGKASEAPMEVLYQRFENVQQRAAELGTQLPGIHFSLTSLTTTAIPFLRICEAGLIDIKQGNMLDLVVLHDSQ